MAGFLLVFAIFVILRWVCRVSEAEPGVPGPIITVGMSRDVWLDEALDLLDERDKRMEFARKD
jgi:hypothetical protein